jgi:hypothetical protein
VSEGGSDARQFLAIFNSTIYEEFKNH